MVKYWITQISNRSSLLRAVLVLIGGTAAAHAITALALPVLTRLYTPEEFSTLAAFSSLLMTISVAACLRFDIAVPLPVDKEEALRLLLLALSSTLVAAVLLGVIALVVPEDFLVWIGIKEVQPYLWLIPIGVLLSGFYSGLQNWFVREKEFSLVAQSRILQAAASSGTQIGSGLLGGGGLGLLIGYLLNMGAGCLILGKRFLWTGGFRGAGATITFPELRLTWSKYHRFPKYSTWEALANSAAIQVPVVMIAALAAGPEAGYLLLAMTVIQAPMSVFGNSIAQVFLSQAPHEYRNNRLGVFTVDILGALFKAGVGPLLAVGILSPPTFELVFGEGWGRAGTLVAWMTPWFIMQFLVTPISMSVHVTGHQRSAFVLQVFGLVLRVAFVWGATQLSAKPVSEAYALSGAIFYSVYAGVVLFCVGCKGRDLVAKLLRSTPIILLWVMISLVIKMVLQEFLG